MDSLTPSLVVIGGTFLDLLTVTPPLHRINAVPTAPDVILRAGGAGAGVAVALAGMGVRTVLFSVIGDDIDGRFIAEDLAERGVDTSALVFTQDAQTGVVVMVQDAAGEHTLLAPVTSTCHYLLPDDHLSRVAAYQPTAIHISGTMLRMEPSSGAVRRFVESWQGRTKLYFDTNLSQLQASRAEIPVEALCETARCCDVIFSTQAELDALGLQVNGRQRIIARTGANGAAFNGSAGQIASAPDRPADAMNRMGAGDAFDAAFIAAELCGMAEPQALAMASIAARRTLEAQKIT